MNGAAPLSVRGLALRVGDRTLCRDLSFDVEAGQCWAIVGPNGAGKTTLATTIAGLRETDAGEIRYAGAPLPALSPRERALRRAFLPQDSQDPFHASVEETVLVGRHPHLPRFAWEGERDLAIARDALARFGLAGFESRDVRTLSGGERRRVGLAALLVQEAPLMLLDEPSSHLDLVQQVAALEVLVGVARERGAALVMVLHDLHLALRYCDHAIAMGGGRADAGPADQLLTEARLSALFGRPLRSLGEGRGRTFVPA